MKAYELEICVDSLESALEAQRMGADRVELCSRLDLDGLTPSIELIKDCREQLTIELFVMIRPRGGDFCYNRIELQQMLNEIASANELGVDGIVTGALLENGNLDVKTSKELIKASGALDFTFHRAFDVCKEPLRVLKQVEELGVKRLLSSGQENKAIEGIVLLKEMNSQCSLLKIMAGSGVNASNISELWKNGIRQFHFTSHKTNEQGINIYDREKTEKAIHILERL